MIKSDNWLLEYGMGIFEPFNREQVNPASYDLRLDNRYIDLHIGKSIVGDQIILQPPKYNIFTFTSSPDDLNPYTPGSAILASTWEYVKIPDDLCGAVFLKSSMARLGLDHALAGWVDPGFEGNLTLELHAHRPITLTAGQRVIQIVLYELDQISAHPYSGRYKGQTGPTMAK